MPSTWNRSPIEMHNSYISNTEAFYRASERSLAPSVDEFVRKTALTLWSHSASINQAQVDAMNELYSKDREPPSYLLWELTAAVCKAEEFLPPLFFWALVDWDKKHGAASSRLFVRMLTNILLCLAAVDDEVTMAEAEFITACADKLTAICDSASVKKTKPALEAKKFVTSVEPSFMGKALQSESAKDAAQSPPTPEPLTAHDLDELMAKLDELIGLETVKKDVKSLVNLMKVRKLRTENGLPVPPMSLHLVFTGNPGTGKTTVARLLSELYAAIGVLKKGQLVEVDRSGLVAGFVGQTAIKTQEAIASSLGGVLFIDEAYSLSGGGENDFGREAIETMLKAMEDHRDDLVVIVAGYSKPMEKFLASNPGLESRFNKFIEFPDYNSDELKQIFAGNCERNGYTLTEEADQAADELFRDIYESRDDNFGNARHVRNIFERMISRQADRVANLDSPTKQELMSVEKEDLI